MTIEEIWKDIKGYEGYYQISNYGRVKSLSRIITGRDGMLVSLKEKILKPLSFGIKDSYFSVRLCRDAHRYKRFIHKLVAEAFIDEIPQGMVVNHIDENPKNNRVDNLEIVTQQVNVQKARNNNKIRKPVRTKIKVIDIDTNEELIFDDCERTAEYIGVSGQTIRTHLNGTWSGITKGKYKISRVS